MLLTVKNLGVISKAEIDLSKDLILLTGENNTGKTYLAYVIYGVFLPYWVDSENVIQWAYEDKKQGQVSKSKIWEFNILDKFEEIISYSLNFSMPLKFAVRNNFFKEADIVISCGKNGQIAKKLWELEISESSKDDPKSAAADYEAFIEKKKNSYDVKIHAKSKEKKTIPRKEN